MGKIRINHTVVQALLIYGGFIWLIALLVVLPHFSDLLLLPATENLGVSHASSVDTTYFAWRVPLTFLFFSLIHTKWSILFPAAWYYAMFAIWALVVIFLFIKGQFWSGSFFLLHTLAFGVTIYFFSLVALRTIHNNMYIKSDHYLVRWLGAVKMSVQEYWVELIGAYLGFPFLNIFSG